MKKNVLYFLALLLTFSPIFAMDIEIITGTATINYMPLYGCYDDGSSNFFIDSTLSGMDVNVIQIQANLNKEPIKNKTMLKEKLL